MEELKEKCDWAPVTPAKPNPNFNASDKTSIHDVKNPQFSQIWGKLGEKEKGVNGGISDKENPNYGFRLVSEKASTSQNNPTPRKRSKVNHGVDLTPRKRARMKRHRPKVFDETKPKKPSTPNQRTPKRSSRSQKKKVNLKASIELLKYGIKEAIDEAIKPSCRRELNFDVEKDTPEVEPNLQLGGSDLRLENDILNVCDGIGDKPEVEPNLQLGSSNLSLEKDILNVCDGIGDKPKVGPKRLLDSSSLRVYRRIFRPNECLKNSRKIGPNCPRMFKKTRTRRIRATSFVKFDFLKKSDEGGKMCDNFTMKLRSRKRKNSSINVSKQNVSKQNVSKQKINTSVSVSEEKINWTVYLTRKRSNTSTRRHDFSSLGIDFSKIEVSEEFLLVASRIRAKVNEAAKFAARAEIQDNGLQNSITENSMGQQELDKGVQNAITENSMGQQELIEDQTVLEIDHQVVKDQNVLFENKVQFIDSEFSQSVKVKANCTKKALEPDSVKPDLAGPNHKQKDAYDDAFIEALVNYACKKMECLNIDDKFNELVVRDVNGENVIVPYKGKFDISKLRKPPPKVDIDPETMRVWNMLMENGGPEDNEQEDDIEDKSNYWKEQHELYRGRVDSFIARMHQIQGDRRFSPWKGSVVDSVVGVFLTQNVSDHLSSSAFMSLAAKFPPEHVIRENDTQIFRVEIPESPPSKCNEPETLSLLENDTQNVQVEIPKSPPSKCNAQETLESYPSPSPKNLIALKPENGNKTPSQTESTPRRKKGNVKVKVNQENTIDWDELRKKYSRGGPRSIETVDTVNWEAVRKARLKDVAEAIAERGMNNILAGRIKDFLNRIVKDHGSIDLEWLRDVPPDKAKDYLLSIPGLGLKSVECVRLLTLHHHAFPVDVNVGRILVRLGWVPLKPLPEDVQIHLLNQYPVLDSIQQYIWPRLCVRDKLTLYEAHYQMITFGKAFCTKRQPNCNACPMRGECKHFASAYASSKLLIGGPEGKNPTTEPSPVSSSQDPTAHNKPPFLISNSNDYPSDVMYNICNIEPIIEIPPSPEPIEIHIEEIDHYNYGSDDEISVIDLNGEEFKKNVLKVVEENNLLCSEGEMSKALVTLRPEHASIPMPKLKTVGRLKTEHQVYELPDSHPLLARFEVREPDDPCPYLLAIWATTDETTDSSLESGKVCEDDQTVRGTILIPCRTANRGSFPLNGTYFQVNEVFAEHESSRNPIAVPREWIWNLRRRTLYCGTSVQSISRGYSMEEIAYCFRHGFICVRGFDTAIRRAKSLATRFHLCKTRPIDNELTSKKN